MQGDLIALVLYIVVSSITPGPNNLMLLHGGLKQGFWACKYHLLGISTGCCGMALLSYWGIAELIIKQPNTLIILKVLGSSYLLWLAWNMWSKGIVPDSSEETTTTSKTKWSLPLTFSQALVFQYINPKAWVMVTILPSIAIIVGDTPYWDNLPLYLLFFILNVFCISLWAGGGNALRRLLHRKKFMYWINVIIVLMTLYCVFVMWL